MRACDVVVRAIARCGYSLIRTRIDMVGAGRETLRGIQAFRREFNIGREMSEVEQPSRCGSRKNKHVCRLLLSFVVEFRRAGRN
jgi:hypothetical protein